MAIALAKEAIDPTERSNPLTDKEIVTPMAIIVTIDIDLRMLTILLPSIKAGFTAVKMKINSKIVMIVPYLYKKSNSLNL